MCKRLESGFGGGRGGGVWVAYLLGGNFRVRGAVSAVAPGASSATLLTHDREGNPNYNTSLPGADLGRWNASGYAEVPPVNATNLGFAGINLQNNTIRGNQVQWHEPRPPPSPPQSPDFWWTSSERRALAVEAPAGAAAGLDLPLHSAAGRRRVAEAAFYGEEGRGSGRRRLSKLLPLVPRRTSRRLATGSVRWDDARASAVWRIEGPPLCLSTRGWHTFCSWARPSMRAPVLMRPHGARLRLSRLHALWQLFWRSATSSRVAPVRTGLMPYAGWRPS